MEPREQVVSLVERARAMPHGPARIALIEEAVRIADVHQEGDYAFWARGSLVQAATWGGRPELAMAAFAWRLAHMDKNPESLAANAKFHVLWHYKWIVDDLVDYPSMSRAQIAHAMEDMKLRYKAAGYSLRAAYQKQMWIAMDMGDDAEAERCHQAWLAEPRDAMSDCVACEQNTRVSYLRRMGRYEEMLEVAGPLLREELSCEVVPAITFGKVLMPLVGLKRKADARRYHNRGWGMIRKNMVYHIDTWSYHVAYLARVGSHAEAATQLDRYMGQALEVFSPLNRLHNVRRVVQALEALAGADHAMISLRLPTQLPFVRDDGSYHTDALAATLRDWVRPVARALDERNGNGRLEALLMQPAT
jgi:hypothetical protein